MVQAKGQEPLPIEAAAMVLVLSKASNCWYCWIVSDGRGGALMVATVGVPWERVVMVAREELVTMVGLG